jgi:divalent metal cation (Fe/Co/Zn/Cd) transporter
MTPPFRWHRVQQIAELSPHFGGPRGSTQRAIAWALVLFLWASLFLLVVKLLLGQSAGAVALLATALHTLLVCAGALLGLMGLRWGPAARAGVLLSGRWEALTLFLLWGLLGFGSLTLLGRLWSPLGGGSFLSQVSHPALLPVVGALALFCAGLALLAQVCARYLGGGVLSLQAYLWVQEIWLTLAALFCMVLVGQGYDWVERWSVVTVVAIALFDAWRLVQAQLPHWLVPQAIAPEAITGLVLQVEGITACRLLHCRGLVGRGVAIALELRLHPEFYRQRQYLGRQIETLLQRHYGPARVEIVLCSGAGGKPVPLELRTLDPQVPDA